MFNQFFFEKLTKSEFFKPLVSLLAIVFVSAILDPAHFLTAYDQQIIAQQTGLYTIMGVGEMLIVLMGSIDLSTSGIYGLGMMVSGYVFARVVHSLGISILVAIIVGIIFGFANGVIVAKGKIFSFIATLATSLIALGAMLYLTNGQSIYPLPAFSVFALSIFQIPVTFIIGVLVVLAIYIFLKYTAIGRYIYAIGGNEDASYYSGINVNLVKITAFTIAGAMYSLAGIMTVGLLESATPIASTYGNLLLYTIAVVVLGGIELTGGVGSPIGPLIGSYILMMISNILVLLNVNVYLQYIVTGILVIIVTISVIRGKRWVK
ncbi:MAG: ABC transporter permease [Nitrososphaeria archaeon]